MKTMVKIVCAMSASLAIGSLAHAQKAPSGAGTAMSLDTILAGDWRSDKNKARDQYRHPKQTLEFFGVTPTQTLIEIYPGGGWYAEILAPLLKDKGHYVAAIIKPDKPAGEGVRRLDLKQAKISSPEGVQGASGAVRTLVAPLRAEQLGSSRD